VKIILKSFEFVSADGLGWIAISIINLDSAINVDYHLRAHSKSGRLTTYAYDLSTIMSTTYNEAPNYEMREEGSAPTIDAVPRRGDLVAKWNSNVPTISAACCDG
jgi:hypothetical protein